MAGDGVQRDGVLRGEAVMPEAGDLGLREPAPVGELKQRTFVLRELLQRAMDAPGDPRALSFVWRAGLGRRLVGGLGRGLGPCSRAVDDRVSCDGIEPGSPRPALRPVARGGAPDRCEGLLCRILGAAAVAEPAQRQREHGPYEAAVEDVERLAVAAGNSLQQL